MRAGGNTCAPLSAHYEKLNLGIFPIILDIVPTAGCIHVASRDAIIWTP
jgi:hypothetical protein